MTLFAYEFNFFKTEYIFPTNLVKQKDGELNDKTVYM